MKTFFVTLFIFLFIQVNAQDIVRLTLNNKVIGKVSISPGTTLKFTAARGKYKNIKTGSVQLIHQQAIPAYKESLEIADENDTVLLLTEESEGKPGNFIFSNQTTIKSLLKHSQLKIFLVQNPRNERMSMPSRRNLLAVLDLK